MRLGSFEVNEPLPELKEPHAISILQPWIDVGGVGTLMMAWLESHFNARELARLIRPGNFFDFTRYRPTIYYSEGVRQMNIPNSYATYSKREEGNDFIFIHLLEPHSHGEAYVESVWRLMEHFGVKRYCMLGSMFDLVPHTRPLQITGSASGEGIEEKAAGLGIRSSTYQGPTSITTLLTQYARDTGIESLSLIVRLPQYTQMDDDYMGTVRLMEVLGALYDIKVDEVYINKAEKQREQINAALEKNPQLQAIVNQLENHYDARSSRDKPEEETPRLSPEVEKFLAEMEKRFREG
jgi:predicted ATP-grasp superfamily ATP-dependent carboligase